LAASRDGHSLDLGLRVGTKRRMDELAWTGRSGFDESAWSPPRLPSAMSGAHEVNQMTDNKPEQTLSRKCNLQFGSDLNERVALEAEEPHEPMIMFIIKQRGLVKA
jgi:hypothetical protein